jgi:hypothetical protein
MILSKDNASFSLVLTKILVSGIGFLRVDKNGYSHDRCLDQQTVSAFTLRKIGRRPLRLGMTDACLRWAETHHRRHFKRLKLQADKNFIWENITTSTVTSDLVSF